MSALKAGWVKAPCRIIRIEGEGLAGMRVESLHRDLDNTTFVGVDIFTKLPKRLTVANHLFVTIL